MTDPTHPETPQPSSPVERDEVSIPLLGLVGALIVVVTLLVAILLQAWFYAGKADLTLERSTPADAPQTALGQALLDQQAKINSYHWVNRPAQVRAIPIPRAMELVARELAAEQERGKGGGKP
jgi:hypothetical protein